MTREEAAKKLRELPLPKLNGNSEEETERWLNTYIEPINIAIKALEQTRWIPVSERLPENSGRYLAYIVNEHDDKLQYIMTCEYLVDGYWNWYPDDECTSDNVMAWMPLPEPYKVESEG